MPSFIQPTPDALDLELALFVELGRKKYLAQRAPRRGGRSYFIVADDHYIDMKAVWYGAVEPKPDVTPTSMTISPILEKMGFTILHTTDRNFDVLTKVERHRRLESTRWSRNRQIADERKRQAGFRCEACAFDASERYVGIDGSVLEVHHLLPFGSGDTNTRRLVTVEDVVALCANCHKMIHALGRQTGDNPSLAAFKKSVQLTTERR